MACSAKIKVSTPKGSHFLPHCFAALVAKKLTLTAIAVLAGGKYDATSFRFNVTTP
jgi:hypothetical protein